MKICVLAAAALLTACRSSPSDTADGAEDVEPSPANMDELYSAEYGHMVETEAEQEGGHRLHACEGPECTAEAQLAMDANQRAVCAASATAAAALGCHVARGACATTTVITVGSTLVPCSLVLLMACVGGPASAVAYVTRFCG
jgi:hypothetical protein